MRVVNILKIICCAVLCYNQTAKADAWNGAHYHSTSIYQYNTALFMLHNTTFNPHDKILDIGCGSGDVTAYIASLVNEGNVIGIDSSPSMIEFATNAYVHTPNINFRVINACNLEVFNNETFDKVVSFNCLHWVEDIQPVFNHIARILKPNGTFLLATAHMEQFLYRSFMKVATSDKWKPYFKNGAKSPWFGHDEISIKSLLDAANLNPEKLFTWHKQSKFENKEKFAAFIRNWIYAVPQLQKLSNMNQEQFIDDIIDTFLQTISFNRDGSFEFDSPILLCVARK